ncbi:MAG: serine/threonine protein kinase, partial [Gemmatimonadetes bacterium]|nr:serine/threonine protein kinase [Gemmatimonadota bacterium]
MREKPSLGSVNVARWQAVERLLDAALDLPEGERAAFLENACADDLELRHEVEQLLRCCERSGSFLEEPAAIYAAPLVASFPALAPAPAEGARVGPYRLLSEAGRGGMGVVYLAERADNGFAEHVALKLVPQALATRPALRRFLQERQILATLDHPHIARLLDGGVTDEGLPYLVMEYVQGTPLEQYCDERRLSVEARLELFLQVCAAVHYAHRNLVIHRDLKPSNILVTDEGAVKLLDFGIAKLLGQEIHSQTSELTGTGMRPMTLHFASPEQVRGEAISVATDVYALGVLLYRLLSGHHPFPVSGRTAGEVERAILEEQPELLSVAVKQPGAADRPPTAGPAAEQLAGARGCASEQLRRRLEGDLDTVVLQALRKEPARRYATAEQFAADIQAHLAGRPVRARRRGAWAYRTGKLLGRRGVRVASAAAAGMRLRWPGFLAGFLAAGGVLLVLSAGPRERVSRAVSNDPTATV